MKRIIPVTFSIEIEDIERIEKAAFNKKISRSAMLRFILKQAKEVHAYI